MAEKRKKIKTMSEAKIAIWEDIGCVSHDAEQGHRNYTYTSHEAVTAAVMPAMYKHGITVRFKCKNLTVMDSFALFKCTACFHHEDSGEEQRCSVYAGDRLRDGTTMGAIMSYAVKIIFVKYFGLSTGEKDLEFIQAEQEAAKAAVLSTEAKKVKKENAAKKEAEKTAEIFDGTIMSTPEEQFEFVELCKEFDLDADMIDKRLEFEGIKRLEEVPQDLMQTWITQMKEKLADVQD